MQPDRLKCGKKGENPLGNVDSNENSFQRLNQQLNSINFEMFVGCRATRAAATTTTTTTANTCSKYPLKIEQKNKNKMHIK